MLKIITNPNPILKKKSKPVTDVFDAEIKKLIPELRETMLKADGLGLAAPQVSQNIRLIAVRYEDGSLAIINPKIIKKSILKEWGEEGCLSVPHTFGQVKRHKSITIQYLDESGCEKKLHAKGMLARVLQHEMDHLDGVLFIDKAKNIFDDRKE